MGAGPGLRQHDLFLPLCALPCPVWARARSWRSGGSRPSWFAGKESSAVWVWLGHATFCKIQRTGHSSTTEVVSEASGGLGKETKQFGRGAVVGNSSFSVSVSTWKQFDDGMKKVQARFHFFIFIFLFFLLFHFPPLFKVWTQQTQRNPAVTAFLEDRCEG